jgi:ubiquinone/menaquinone biosynthesis C-methylase UbiE
MADPAAAAFARVRPKDDLTRLATSELSASCKSGAVTELGIGSGTVVLDLGCGAGVDLPAFADALRRSIILSCPPP